MNYVYGPVPSRRLGLSLGVSPIPKKTCNYSCTYCQLGRTDHLSNTRKMFYPVLDIIEQLETNLAKITDFDVVTIVGEGEPTLYLGLGELIEQIKLRTDKPVAVITNGALVYDPEVRADLGRADIVLLSIDAYDEATFHGINRPLGTLKYTDVYSGLMEFAKHYQGQLWLEIMLMDAINDSNEALAKFKSLLKDIPYHRLYLNTPVRPPAEANINTISPERMEYAVDLLGGISIDLLESQGFYSEISDHYAAIMSIIRRHPMNQFEIEGFLKSRGSDDPQKVISALENDTQIDAINYKGFTTFRLK